MHYKRTNYFKILGNLRGYLKEYKKVCFSLLCVFVLCAAYILTTHTNAEIREFENYTYVESTSLSTDTMQYDTLARSSTDDAYIINDTDKITSVKISTDKNNEGVGNGTITPDTKYLKITVDFKDIPAESLKKQYNNSFRYNLPDFFRTTSIAKRPIVDENNKTIGTIHVENGQAIVTYTNDFLGELGDNATLSGSFFVEGEVDLTKINKEDGSVQAQVPNGNITLDYGLNYLERYSEVKVEKSYEKDPSSDYIKYQLTVTAGPDGSQNVYVVDKFTTNKNLVTYAGDIPNTPKILGTSENGQQPYETKTTNAPSGKIYLTNQPTSEREVPDPVNTSITQPGSIVWSMEKLNPNEKRTLTYYVLLTDKQNVRNQSITNEASVLNKKGNETYLKGSSEKTFTPLINYQMTKDIVSTNGQQYTKDDDGNYIVQYRLNFTLNGDSNCPLKNYAFFDYLNYKDANYNDRDTDEKMLPYISYVQDSVELHQIKEGKDSTIAPSLYKVQWEADGTNYKDTYEGNPKRFKLSGAVNNPITINPGDSYYVTYKLKIKPEVYAAMQSEQVTIKNIYANNADNAKKLAGMLDRTKSSQDLVLNEYTWIQKIKDSNLTSENKKIQMNENVYVKKNNSYEKDSSDKSFEVPKGSYKYTVNLNESQNQFDITHATLKDELSSDIMHYVGYVKITAYAYDKRTDTYKDGESKWVKIDNQKSFELKLSELDWSNNNYGYRFEYYAQTKDLSQVGKINVTNTFTLNGDVKGEGDNTFNFINKSASQTTQVNGFYNLNVNKGAWYYEKPVEKATTWKNGAFYWVIKVNGSAIRKGTQIRDAVVQENDTTDSYLHSDSVVGIYQGNLINQVGAYKNYKEFKSSNKGLKDQSKLFGQEYTNDKNFSGEDNKSELTLTAKQDINLQNNEDIYIIVKTEPSKIPTANRTTFNYKNEVLLKDTTDKSFIKQNGVVTQSLYGGADLLKEFNCTFSYDGNQATILETGTDSDPSRIATDILKTTTGNGIYASWVFKVNYAGDLKGDYQVLEDIPKGMELGYIRIKWHGNKAGTVESKRMDDLGSDWKDYSNTATNDNGGNQSTTYYYNKTTNKALIKLGEFVNGHIRDECSIDVQVACRVTDPKVLLGGESKEFMNVVTLQDEKGKDLATSSCPATLQKNSLDKNHLEPYNGHTIKYTITANALAQNLPPNDGNELTLVDVLGKTLELDITSIEARDDAGENVKIKIAFDSKTNTLEISIPNGKKIIITYTVTVNIPPDTPSEVSNNVYWKSYESQGGKNDVIPDFRYNLNAGGSTTTTENPELSIKKIDQDTAKPLNGVAFDIYECKLNGDQIKRVEGSTISGKTDENGVLTVKSPFVTSYNKIYEVKEKNAPDGYMQDDSSYYIICVDKGNSDKYTDDVQKCIDYFNNQSNRQKYKVAYLSTDFKLTIYNSQKGIVVKKAFINNAAGTSNKPVSGTYTFGLYNKSDGSGSPIQEKTITYRTGDTEVKTTKFINLELGKTYYVFELDDKGRPITNTSQEVTVNKLPYVVDYKVKEESTSKAVVGDQVKVTNSLRTKKLPSSGSRLTQIFRQLGLVMVGISFIVLLIVYKNRDKKIKEEEIGK